MKREEKNALSQKRISEAAMREFSLHGYEEASLNTICAENGISKGIIYHYFKDKDELYLLCVEKCFSAAADYLKAASAGLTGTVEERLRAYFDYRLRFFAENRELLGIYAGAVFSTPEKLAPQIAARRRSFDELNISVLTALLQSEPLRGGLSVEDVVADFGMYMDYFNLHFRSELSAGGSAEELLREHEERCHRQLDILLYGVIKRENEG